jgi:hypothetical protein
MHLQKKVIIIDLVVNFIWTLILFSFVPLNKLEDFGLEVN